MRFYPGTPTGACNPLQLAKNTATGALYDCFGGVWTAVGGAAPTLNQVLDPTADKTFSLGAHNLTFTGTAGVFQIGPSESLLDPSIRGFYGNPIQLVTSLSTTASQIGETIESQSSNSAFEAQASGNR
jgi:hypothetical protein